MRAHLGSKLAQDRSVLAQVGLKMAGWPLRPLRWLSLASEAPADAFKINIFSFTIQIFKILTNGSGRKTSPNTIHFGFGEHLVKVLVAWKGPQLVQESFEHGASMVPIWRPNGPR